MTSISLLGVGAMGAAMAEHLLDAGHPLTVFDPKPGRTAPLVARGAREAPTAARASAGADVVVVVVATADQAQRALLGPDGALAGLAAGTAVLLMSTIGVDAVRALAAHCAEHHVALIDAPVSGGVRRARAGTLLVMVGAGDDAHARARPVLDALGDPVVRVGDEPGEGQKVKLVNQLLCGVHIAAAAEALSLADAMGLDVAATWETIRTGAAASFMLDDRGARMIHGAGDTVNSAVSIFTKDLGLVADAASAADAPARLASSARALFDAAAAEDLAGADDSALYGLLRRTRATDPDAGR